MKKISIEWYRKWGVWLALLVLACIISASGLWATYTWGNDWPTWFSMLAGMVNLLGAMFLIFASVEENKTPALKVPLLIFYYLVCVSVIYFVPYLTWLN